MHYKVKECLRGSAKALLLGLNGLCILVALCMIGCAAVDAKILQQYSEGEACASMVADFFIIFASLILVAIASFGCVGAARENVQFLYLYTGFLIILMVTELMLTIFVSLQRYGLEFRVRNYLTDEFFRNTTGEEIVEYNQLWQNLQTNYECCGLNGPEDYEALGKGIDISCCARAFRAKHDHAREMLHASCMRTKEYYNLGCEEKILFALKEGSECLYGVAILLYCFETIGILLSMWIANNLKNEVKIYKETLRY